MGEEEIQKEDGEDTIREKVLEHGCQGEERLEGARRKGGTLTFQLL